MTGTADPTVIARPSAARRMPLIRVAILPGESPLVAPGDRVSPGTPILRRLRHAQVVDQPLHGRTVPEPGTSVAEGAPLAGDARGPRFEGAGEVLYATPGGRVRAAVSRHDAVLLSPVTGVVESLDYCALTIRGEGPAAPAVLAVGDPSHGALVLGVERPDAELHANQIDARHADAVLVAGARVDVEGLTRARAMGVRGVLAGGVVGGDLLAFRASLERQEASIHASPSFALLVLDGFGKRPIPWSIWEMLRSAEGRVVGISITPPLILFEPGTAVPPETLDRVRVAAGSNLGRGGRLVELLGARRQPGGLYQDCARVALDPVALPGSLKLVDLPLADLERDG